MIIELDFEDLSGVILTARHYDSELDDVRSILVDVCRSVERVGIFLISGFGQDRWPLDIGTDLPIFLEQLPSLLSAAISHDTAQLDFYGQGIERTITFRANQGRYVVSCLSQTYWQPSPSTEYVAFGDLQKALEKIRDDFMRAVRIVAPSLQHHPWLLAWGAIA